MVNMLACYVNCCGRQYSKDNLLECIQCVGIREAVMIVLQENKSQPAQTCSLSRYEDAAAAETIMSLP